MASSFSPPSAAGPVALGSMALAASLVIGAPVARAEVQLRCDGTLLEARGNAEVERTTRRLEFSLSLQAEAPQADAALALLQRRLADVRTSLQQQGVQQLRVSSPSTWPRPAETGRPAQVEASLQVSGRLAPERLQALIRGVGGLPGVRLSPVQTSPDSGQDAAVRRQLLQGAYRDALSQARELANAIGRPRLEPLAVQLEGSDLRPVAMRMVAEAAPPPFDPAELPTPRSSLSMMVRFCAR